MKKKVHRAFVEELPQGHELNWERGPGVVAACLNTCEYGGSADAEFIDYGGRDPITRALSYLDERCDAEHVL